MRFLSRAEAETKRFAAALAKKSLKNKRRKMALVFALTGGLGSGKTTFVQAFARALGVKNRLLSPTFLIIRGYKLPTTNYKFLYHVDAYRLKKTKELEVLGFKKIFGDPQNIVLVEWADKIRKTLPLKTNWLKFRHGRKPNERILILKTRR